jgi:acetoin utilization deacetylase AcuC-like enzyme
LVAYAHATKTVILPVVRRYCPGVVLVSLGFDGREGDPQGNMRLKGVLARALPGTVLAGGSPDGNSNKQRGL